METEQVPGTGMPDAEHAQRGGMPGDGRGRVDVTGHSGVYPVSAMGGASGAARLQGEASWGQGDRGAAGYADHGESEFMPMPPDSDIERTADALNDEAETPQ